MNSVKEKTPRYTSTQALLWGLLGVASIFLSQLVTNQYASAALLCLGIIFFISSAQINQIVTGRPL